MNRARLIERLTEVRNRLPDESKAAKILDTILGELSQPAAKGGGNGNGPPDGP